jgi:hypothetical protein
MKMVDPAVYRAALDRIDIMKLALKQIEKGEGRFDHDHLQHAINTIENMKEIATGALDEVHAAEVWDATPLDENGIPVHPGSALQREADHG